MPTTVMPCWSCCREWTLRVRTDRKSTRLNSSHSQISYAVFCLKKKKIDLGEPRTRQLHHDSPLPHYNLDKCILASAQVPCPLLVAFRLLSFKLRFLHNPTSLV